MKIRYKIVFLMMLFFVISNFFINSDVYGQTFIWRYYGEARSFEHYEKDEKVNINCVTIGDFRVSGISPGNYLETGTILKFITDTPLFLKIYYHKGPGEPDLGFSGTMNNGDEYAIPSRIGYSHFQVAAFSVTPSEDNLYEFDLTLYPSYSVSFNLNGHGNNIPNQYRGIMYYQDWYLNNYYETTNEPSEPIDLNYEFKGWYSDSQCTIPFVFGKKVDSDTILYAKWEEKTAEPPIPIPTPPTPTPTKTDEPQEPTEPPKHSEEPTNVIVTTTIKAGASGKDETETLIIKALKPDITDEANQVWYGNWYMQNELHRKIAKVDVLISCNLYPPYGKNNGYKQSARILYWDNTGAKLGDEIYAVWYCQSSKKPIQVIKCDVEKDGTVKVKIPMLGDMSTVSLIKIAN